MRRMPPPRASFSPPSDGVGGHPEEASGALSSEASVFRRFGDPSAALEPRTGAPIGSDLASANAEIGSSPGSTSDADAAG